MTEMTPETKNAIEAFNELADKATKLMSLPREGISPRIHWMLTWCAGHIKNEADTAGHLLRREQELIDSGEVPPPPA